MGSLCRQVWWHCAGEGEEAGGVAIQRLFYWGAYADKYGGTVQVRGEGQGVWPYRGCFIGELMQTSMVALCRGGAGGVAIQRLFYWGAYADKYGGTVQVRGEGQGVWPYRGCFIGELMQTSMVALCR